MTRRGATHAASAAGAGHPARVSPTQTPAARPISEHALQVAVSQFLAAALPADAWYSSIDHAGTSARHGALLKARGVRKGLPDILILSRAGAIFIELKALRGTWPLEQMEFSLAAARANAAYDVCRSVDEVAQFLGRCGVRLRGRVA